VFLGEIRRAADDVGSRVATDRHRMLLLSLLGGLGLLLALVGILSMTAYAVARRTQEVGVRMAFGAPPSAIVFGIVRDTAWPIGLGLIVGLVSALYATRVLSNFLFKTSTDDTVTFMVVAVLMTVTALFAAWLPARRAARIDPIIALRAE
jgi:ABC-type antimicrobial peptide transport system permease subunit